MPNAGEQACGDVGLGRICREPEDLAHQVTQYFHQAQRALVGKIWHVGRGNHVTITAGPTREARPCALYF